MEVERAKAIADVAGKIIESAKVEVKYAEVTGALIESELLAAPKQKRLEAPRGASNGRNGNGTSKDIEGSDTGH